MTSIARSSGWAALLLGACTLVACAAAPKAEMQPGVPGGPVPVAPAASLAVEPEPRTLEEAEARLEKALADLEQLALNDAPRSASGAAATPAPAPAPPAAQESRTEADGAPVAKSENQCQNACRAFSSLERARVAVCRLDAEGGKRCERARQIRDDASQRVASCGCVQ